MERHEELKSSRAAMMVLFACLSAFSAAATTVMPLMIHA